MRDLVERFLGVVRLLFPQEALQGKPREQQVLLHFPDDGRFLVAARLRKGVVELRQSAPRGGSERVDFLERLLKGGFLLDQEVEASVIFAHEVHDALEPGLALRRLGDLDRLCQAVLDGGDAFPHRLERSLAAGLLVEERVAAHADHVAIRPADAERVVRHAGVVFQLLRHDGEAEITRDGDGA
jgi:hypothetical protein